MSRYRRSTTTSATLCLCDCVRWQEATNPSPFPASSRLVGLGLISSRREGTAALHHHLKITLLVLLRCNSDVSFPILRYLNRAIISWGMGDWGRPPFWPPPPPLNTPLDTSPRLVQWSLSCVPVWSLLTSTWSHRRHDVDLSVIQYCIPLQCESWKVYPNFFPSGWEF